MVSEAAVLVVGFRDQLDDFGVVELTEVEVVNSDGLEGVRF